nr:MAG TPA: hypothetical protein [Caudoviricetes sp.]
MEDISDSVPYPATEAMARSQLVQNRRAISQNPSQKNFSKILD